MKDPQGSTLIVFILHRRKGQKKLLKVNFSSDTAKRKMSLKSFSNAMVYFRIIVRKKKRGQITPVNTHVNTCD